MVEPESLEIEIFRSEILKWGKENFREFPWRFTDNPWHALVAEIMLQRTKAEQVVPAFVEFCTKYPTPDEFCADEESDVFGTLGLRWRDRYLKELARALRGRQIPQDKKELVSLPGIGAYIASAFRSMHLNLYDVIIDANIVRIYGRYFGFETDGETRRKKWFISLAEQVTPPQDHRQFNYGLLDFTREVCKVIPDCGNCPLNQRCLYFFERTITPTGAP